MTKLTDNVRATVDELRSKWVVFGRLRDDAAYLLDLMLESLEDAERVRKDYAQRLARKEIELKAAKDSHSLSERIRKVIYELNRSTRPKPVAIIISPAQHEELLNELDPSRRQSGSKATFCDLPILTASGIAGPVAVTQSALDAISRQAPELLLHEK